MALSLDLLEYTQRRQEEATTEVEFRRVISSAYYASWHAVCESIACKFAQELRPVVCRCPAHEKVKVCAGGLRSRKSKWLPSHELSDDMDTFCTRFIQLQKSRHKADYSLIDSFTAQDSLSAYLYSKSIVEELIPALNGALEYDAFILDCIGIKPSQRD